mgnify:CR=1 FL=1
MNKLIVFLVAVGVFLKLIAVRIIYGKEDFQILYISLMQQVLEKQHD